MFVNAVLIGINPFDQFGVELGKEMAKVDRPSGNGQSFDASTRALIDRALGSGDCGVLGLITVIATRCLPPADPAYLDRTGEQAMREAMMADYDYDLCSSSAPVRAGYARGARLRRAYGAKVAIAEEHRVGGTCVIRGCVPKKLLVYGAHFAEDLQDAQAGSAGRCGDCRFRLVGAARPCVRGGGPDQFGLYTNTLHEPSTSRSSMRTRPC